MYNSEPIFWDSYNDGVLTDFIFDSNLSMREIALHFGVTEKEVRERVRWLGLGWVRRGSGFASRGQAAIAAIMKKLLPRETITCEEPIGERLRLDVYCDRYKLAAEYHGRQHFMYVEHFHGNLEGFRESQRRDERKLEICRDLGIALVAFRYNDHLSEDTVYSRLLEGIRSTPYLEEEEKRSVKDDPFYEAYMQRQRAYRKEAYRRMKNGSRRRD